MEESPQELQIRYEDKSLKAAELAKTAAEMTHTVYTANRKSQKAFDAIRTCDKKLCGIRSRNICESIPILSITPHGSPDWVFIVLTKISMSKPQSRIWKSNCELLSDTFIFMRL